MPTLDEFSTAAESLRGIIVHTPLVPLHTCEGGSDILLKLEIHQPVTSFKIRGIYHAVASLTDEQRAKGLSTVSAGNTAQALAWCGRRFGVKARSLMPDHAPKSKVDAVRAYGGEPVLVPMDEVFRYLKEHRWEDEPYAFIHPWTNRNVMIGHGSIALEIIKDCPEVESVFIPVGGGGLLGGVGSALKRLKPEVKIFAVEPEGCPSLHESLKLDAPTTVKCETICDGVAVPYITEEMFPLLKELVDESVLVSEKDVKAKVRRLALGNKIIAEPSGALATAAARAVDSKRRGLSVCLVTGGSIDVEKLLPMLHA